MKATEKQKQQMREQYQKVKNDIKPRKQKWYIANKDKMATYYKENKERILEQKRLYNRQLRQKAIDAYGGKCACCGISQYEFLALDHVKGGGNIHRKALGFSGNAITRYVIKNGYPQEFRVLCHNCNCAIGFYGSCPHHKHE